MTMTPDAMNAPAHGAHIGSHLWRHFVEMFAVMMLGMIASAAVFLTIVQMTWDEAIRERPTASLLVIAAGMGIPMAAWMLYRGMGRRNAAEMAAAMVLPVIPFLVLVWFGITNTALCGPLLHLGDRGDARTDAASTFRVCVAPTTGARSGALC